MMSIIDTLLGTIPMLKFNGIKPSHVGAIVHLNMNPVLISTGELFDVFLTPSSWPLPFIVSWQHSSDVDP